MQFPEYERVIYGKNPLVEVLFQIRVPQILRLAAESPIAFHDRIKDEFPIVDVRKDPAAVLGGPGLIHQSIGSVNIYDFFSKNRIWKLSLGAGFIALTTAKYERWEEFRRLSKILIASTLDIYSPPVFNRIGLRYKDIVDKDTLGLKDVLWKDLLNPQVCGIYQNIDNIENERSELLFSESKAQFRIECGKATLQSGVVTNQETGKVGFMIDSDYFCDEEMEAELNAGLSVLDNFNGYSGRVFRWCIKDRLHEAMEPTPA